MEEEIIGGEKGTLKWELEVEGPGTKGGAKWWGIK